ncbi:flocculation protein FLO11-like isoform X2 [Elysia marginata]|uniref:Flocculation protein FLO11-like isoform X2 n=1 Tax=Elysia marginata TaxID=1093978 RepID=A0AAV4IFD5_9GAST|nr:flocculation protein FLO11-like isoform X2 [Elysia marginata]
MDASKCGMICQHPGCWASRRREEKGLARSLPPLKFDEDSSDDEIQLPTQSICNLLEDYGESPMDRYPLSTGGRPSHSVNEPLTVPRFSPHSFHSSLKLDAPHNTTASILSKQTRSTKPPVKRNPRLRLVEVQEVFDRDDLRAQWDETFVTKQYYVWMPNPGKHREQLPRGYKDDTGVSTAPTNPVLMKDLTECMVPFDVEQKREETILKKQPRTRSPGKTPRVREASQLVMSDDQIDREGDFTSPGRLHTIVQHVTQDDKTARVALAARFLYQYGEQRVADKRARHEPRARREPRASRRRLQDIYGHYLYYDSSSTKPVNQLDTHADIDHGIIDRLSSVNTPVKKKKHRPVEDERGVIDEGERPDSEADSVETFPRYARPLPGIKEPMGHPRPAVATQRVLHYRGKIPSISLGLPELPSGIKTTKPFSYKRQDLDFSLGPVITPPSSYRSSEGVAYSDHGTTVKVNVPSTMPGIPDSHYRDEDLTAIHSVSPALSTNVPVPPAGTPATFAHGSPTKSAPAGPLQQQYSWDTTRVTINWSQSALPPSPGIPRGDSAQVAKLLSTPNREGDGDALDREGTFNEERALDTINETAREGPPVEVAEETKPAKTSQKVGEVGDEVGQGQTVQPQPPTLQLETSTLRRIGAGASPRQNSARSVESCPSPEQWPLISESSFENVARPSVSEPALSARSDRRRPISRDSRRDLAARRAMDDSKMKTESPAPPPPSPEPKDHPGESRARKDLRSRDSLTMAPLFEVAELDESSPGREDLTLQAKRHTSQSSRAVGGKRSKKIEVTVPVESRDVVLNDDKESEDKAGEMISQMTIMHVIPKGRRQGEKRTGELERVQETFLNVDIPAEDVSSVKAEHGSSHQEDISSSDTVVKSHTTGSEASVTLKENQDIPENEVEKNLEKEIPPSEVECHNGEISSRDKSQVDAVPNSHREMLDLSNESLEMLCDSARFISHEQVSPVEGENDGGEMEGSQSHRFVLGGLEGLGEEHDDDDNDNNEDKLKRSRERKESLLGNLTRRLDQDSTRTNDDADKESAFDDGEGTVSEVGKEDKPSEEEKLEAETQLPGVFFFQGSSPSESSSDKIQGQEDTAPDAQQEMPKDPDAQQEMPKEADAQQEIPKKPEPPAGNNEKETENSNIVPDKEAKEEFESQQVENKNNVNEAITSQAVHAETEAPKDMSAVTDTSAGETTSTKESKEELESQPTGNDADENAPQDSSKNEDAPLDSETVVDKTTTNEGNDQNQKLDETDSTTRIEEDKATLADVTEGASDSAAQLSANEDQQMKTELEQESLTATVDQPSADGTGSEEILATEITEGGEFNNNNKVEATSMNEIKTGELGSPSTEVEETAATSVRSENKNQDG